MGTTENFVTRSKGLITGEWHQQTYYSVEISDESCNAIIITTNASTLIYLKAVHT